ncbi:hypothetical protein I79_013444 [Cricetulus griseus]|uniref:Uncharacterized protein n=1 Tax=Cricetulus griseus TaxID=10029 RepID=G3HRH3_CRIGR|nr:hypothetical protein I79_013444 [Cricetulus griseus]
MTCIQDSKTKKPNTPNPLGPFRLGAFCTSYPGICRPIPREVCTAFPYIDYRN